MNLAYRLLWALLLAAGAAAGAAQTPARLQPAQSEVTFVTRQMGVPVEGKFRTFDATLDLDPKKPESGSASVQINMLSAEYNEYELVLHVANRSNETVSVEVQRL